MTIKTFILDIIWRLQFKKVPYEGKFKPGRCIDCDGWKGEITCADRYCPCNYGEQLKRR